MSLAKRGVSAASVLLMLGVPVFAQAQVPGKYLLTDLGTLSSQSTANSIAFGVNASGQVAGVSSTTTANNEFRAFLTPGLPSLALTNLGIPAGSNAAGTANPFSYGYAVNNSGTVVGYASATPLFAVTGSVSKFNRAMAYFNGTMYDLGTTGPANQTNSGGFNSANASQAFAINNNNVVVGQSSNAVNGQNSASYIRAFKLDLNVSTTLSAANDLGTLGGAISYAQGINDAGTVVGRSQYTATGPNTSVYHAFYTDAMGILHDLGTIGKNTTTNSSDGYSSEAFAINNNGTIVGRTHFSNNTSNSLNTYQPFRIRTQDGQTTLTTAHKLYYSEYDPVTNRIEITGLARAINNNDVMVGEFNVTSPPNSEAFIGTDKAYKLTNYVVNIGTWKLISAYGINDDGVIVGSGNPDKTNTAIQHAYLLTPVFDVTGTLTFEGISGAAPNQNVTFTFSKPGYTNYIVTKSVPNTGVFSLTNVPFGNYQVNIKADRYLRKNLTVNISAGNVTGLTATLKAGDHNGDNAVDVADLLAIINHYNQQQNNPANNSNYLEVADFNLDGANDVADLLTVINNYNQLGD